jgi:hypothetical protein
MTTEVLEQVEAPSRLMPARGTLIRKLSEYTASTATLKEFKSRLARVEIDESNALESGDDDLLGRAQSQRGIYVAKIANREAALVKQLGELKTAVSSASQELSELVRSVFLKQHDSIAAAVMEVLEPAESFNPLELDDLLEHDARLVRIRKIELPSFIDNGSADGMVGFAKVVLDGFDAVITEGKKEL